MESPCWMVVVEKMVENKISHDRKSCIFNAFTVFSFLPTNQ